MAMKKCPVCGASVKVGNLERHVTDTHPRAKVDVSTLVTEKERRAATPKKAAPPPTVTKGGKRLIAVVAILVAVVLILIIVNPFRPRGPQVGDPAPDFTIGACPSGTVDLTSYLNSVTVLELMDVDCAGCRSEAPILAAVFGQYNTQGVRFLSVSLIDWVPEADTCASIDTFARDHGTTWTYGLDTDRAVREAYFPGWATSPGAYSTPTTYILDRDGVIRAKMGPQGSATPYATALETVLGP